MFALVLKAELSGVTDLRPQDTADNPFWLSSLAMAEVRTGALMKSQETNEMSGSRGEANFVWRCKNCKRESSASIKTGPAPYAQSEPPEARTLLEFDCRGLEFTEFKPEGDWEAQGAGSGTKFTAIDLSEGEWYDYDDKAGEEVSIKDISWEIRRA